MSTSSSISGFVAGPSCISSSSIDSKRIALDQCIERIKHVIHSVKLEILNGNFHLNKMECPSSLDVMKDPVVTNCGHIFEQNVIQAQKDKAIPCALCNTQISTLSPIHELRNLINCWQEEDPIPTCSNFKGSNLQRKERYITTAKSFIEEKDYQEALKCYTEAFKYTNASEDYAAIPSIYDQLGETKKALLSRLILSSYQLQEGKIQEAINTIKDCGSDDLNVSSLILELTLQSLESFESIKLAMTFASNQKTAEDKIFIYNQIIAHPPLSFLDAYIQLISLTKDKEEKKELLSKAADLAHVFQQLDLEKTLRLQLEIPTISNVISKEEWANAQNVKLPPYPKELQDFLDGDCTIWRGKKRYQTHIVVPLFPQVNIDGLPIPLTLDSLDRLDKSSGGLGIVMSGIPDQIPRNIPAKEGFHYAVMTNDVISGSKCKSYQDSIKLLPDLYEVPGILDVSRAFLWGNRRTGSMCFNHDSVLYLRCKEPVYSYRWVVGISSSPSFSVVVSTTHDSGGNNCLGLAGWREF